MYKKLFTYVILGLLLNISFTHAMEEGLDISEQVDQRFPRMFECEMVTVPFLLSGAVSYGAL